MSQGGTGGAGAGASGAGGATAGNGGAGGTTGGAGAGGSTAGASGASGAGAAGSAGSAGQSGASGAAGSAGASPLDLACASYAEAECAALDLCENGFAQDTFGSTDACQARYVQSCLQIGNAPGSGKGAGEWQACATATSGVTTQADCAAFYNGLPQCSVPGALCDGSPCAFPAQCASDYCAYSGGKFCGVCSPQPAVGASCNPNVNNPCGTQGLVCSTATNLCEKPAILGGSCDSNAPCPVRSGCQGSTKTCVLFASTKNDPCDPSGDSGPLCDGYDDLFCNAVSDTCQSRTPVSTEGAPCGKSMDGASFGYCVGGLYCYQGACRAPLPDGAPCSQASGSVECTFPSHCFPTTFGAAGAAGEAGASGSAGKADCSTAGSGGSAGTAGAAGASGGASGGAGAAGKAGAAGSAGSGGMVMFTCRTVDASACE
jgi:hypothetical protein